jgi:hypothetical protein
LLAGFWFPLTMTPVNRDAADDMPLSDLTARHIHGSNSAADDPLVWYSGGATRWLHADHQGSIVAATKSSVNNALLDKHRCSGARVTK